MSDNSFDQLVQDIDGIFHQLFRAAGVTLKPDKDYERIRSLSASLAKTIEHRAEVQAVTVIKRLQEGVKKAFELMEKDLQTKDDDVEIRFKALELRLADIENKLYLKGITKFKGSTK